MKIKLIVSSVVAVMALASCNLDYSEYSNYKEDYIKLNFQNVGGLVTDIYAKLDYDFGTYDGAFLGSASDESEYAWKANPIHDFYNGAWSPVNSKSGTWTGSYSGIQSCNLFLSDYLGLTFPELALNVDYEAEMFRYKNYENEVRFLRAYFYFNLVRQYGDVPLYTSKITVQDVNTLSRTPSAKVFDFIVKECDDIVDLIPVDYSALGGNALPSETETGRVGRLAVLALKARTLLYAASPLFNKENDKELWKKAALANKAVLDSCAKYGVVLGKYADIWGQNNWTNKEMLFVRRIGDQNSLEQYNFPIGVEGGNSGNCPTQNMVDAYEMKSTGKRWDEKGSGYDPAKPYEGRDPRFYLTIAKNEDKGWPSYNTLPLQTYYGGANGEPISGATPTGYYLKKYCDVSVNLTASKENKKRHSWVTYRLGEFYLNYAEAVFNYLGTADATSSELSMSARNAVNTVRARGGVEMPPFAAGLSATDFWDKYTNERMVELAFEGHRFWDVRRWKEGEKFKTITLMKITKNADETFTYTRQTRTRIWDDKMYLFPIPQSERMKNPNLAQNPGY